jgi:hypothetical protein
MSEQLQDHGSWEVDRRTGRYVADPETTDDANQWLAALGKPLVENETYKEWADRTAEHRGDN